MNSFAAALLAGGRSSRMGFDKAFLLWEGRELWRHQLEKLRALGGPMLLSCREAQEFPPVSDLCFVNDLWPDCGPLGGIASCLRAMEEPLLVVIGVDLPHLPAEMLRDLLAASRPECGAVIKRGDLYEPLAAVYPTGVLPLAEEMLHAGDRKMQHFLRRSIESGRMQALDAPPGSGDWFTNWNTPGIV